jgi:hypothetical protein
MTRPKTIIRTFFTAIITITAVSCQNSPVTVWQSNPHYFSYKDKPIILISSDHHYGAIIDRDFDYVKFLDYLAQNGINLTRIYPGAMFEPTDKYLPGNPLGPGSGRQILPWEKSSESGASQALAEPGQPSFKYDLDRWNREYFNRLTDFVKKAGDRGIIVEVAFFNGMYNDCWPLMAMYHQNNIQGIGKYEAEECGLFTTDDPANKDVIKYQAEYVRKITSELNQFDNVIFDICDEPSLQGLPGGGVKYLPDSLVAPWIEKMKDAFLGAEKILPVKHLLGQTVQNLSPDLSGEKWCKWLAAEYVKPAEKALELDYKCNKPIINVESNYYGMSLTRNAYDADAVRLEGWWFMLGGGAGCINLNGEFFRGKETGSLTTQTLIIPQKKLLKDFMSSLDLKGLSRFNDFSLPGENLMCKILAEPGKQYALYLFHGDFEGDWGAHFIPQKGKYNDSISLNNVPSGEYLVEWIEPSTGDISKSETLSSRGGKVTLLTPEYPLDIAMRMIRK